MKDFRTRENTQKRFIYSWIFLVILFIILFFLGRSAFASFGKKRNADKERIKFQEKMETLEDAKLELESRINNLKTDRGLEEELRKRFNVVREGETMIRLIEEDPQEN